ncbi:hypothetical protein KBD20_01030, partial [Candidatus Saccharibacteria bacterium]|nr:hypothetical protein [Candidatus Saccharibacteria bacterium]
SDPTKPGSQTPGAAPDGYDISKEDDVHICGDPLPTASIDTVPVSGKTYTLKSYVTTGKYTLQTVEFIVNGQVVNSQPASASGEYSTSYTFPTSGSYEVQVRVTDVGYYQSTKSDTELIP